MTTASTSSACTASAASSARSLTGVFASTALGGVGYAEGVSMAGQVITQVKAVCVTIVWCGLVSFILYKLIDMTIGLRVAPEIEREGLDLAEHGERAYVY